MSFFLIKGALLHSLSLEELEIIPNGILLVEKLSGKIAYIGDEKQRSVSQALDSLSLSESQIARIIELGEGQFLVPGFVDVHTHAPQYLNCGIGIDEPLLQWLDKYTFPAESKCSNLNFAKHIYEKCVQRHLQNGTTTCVYFATIHKEASLLLADTCRAKKQRAFIGKVNMDRNAPDFYIETTEDSIKETEEFIKSLLQETESKTKSSLVQPIITPRFVPTCTPQLMKALGDITEKYPSILVQSHVSENWSETLWVKELHPECDSYLEVYDQYGLLPSKRTIMAHAVHMGHKEIQLMKEKEVLIAHCPLSNFTLKSGICNVRQMLNNGIKVALGTDCSGGYSPSMLNAIRNTLIASQANTIHHRDDLNVQKQLEEVLIGKEPDYEKTNKLILSLEEIFYLATLGGADGIGLSEVTGNFSVGKEFDALLIDLNAENSPLDAFCDSWKPHEMYSSSNDTYIIQKEKLKLYLQRFLLLGDDRNIKHIFVQGSMVK